VIEKPGNTPPKSSQKVLPELLPPRRENRSSVWRLLLGVIGSSLILFGIAGLVLPLAPGVIPIIIGLALLGMTSPTARRWINRSETHLPHKYRLLLRKYIRKAG
jgi:hypothetical protein